MTGLWRYLAVGLLGSWLAVGMIGPREALAEGPPQAIVNPTEVKAGRIRVDAMVVHANHSGRVDPGLRLLKEKLSHLRFTGFNILSSQTETVAQGQTATVRVAGGRRMRISFLDHTNKVARVRIQLFKGDEKKMDTTVQLPWNKVFVVGGPSHDGGKLVFPIVVSY